MSPSQGQHRSLITGGIREPRQEEELGRGPVNTTEVSGPAGVRPLGQGPGNQSTRWRVVRFLR